MSRDARFRDIRRQTSDVRFEAASSERLQHSADLVDLPHKFPATIWVDESSIDGDNQMMLRFVRATDRNAQETRPVFQARPAARFRKIRSDRVGGALELRRQAISMFARKRTGEFEHGTRQLAAAPPHIEIAEVPHTTVVPHAPPRWKPTVAAPHERSQISFFYLTSDVCRLPEARASGAFADV